MVRHCKTRERLPPLKSTASAAEIIRWKESLQVDDCYRALFEKNSEEVFWVSIITRTNFSMVAIPTLTNYYCAFTLAMCDILLNLRSKTVLCKDKLMKRRMSQYLNDFDNGSPNHNSAEEIMNSEIAGRPAAKMVRQSSSKLEPEPNPVPVCRRSSSMMSIEELDELFEINQ
ncbi:28545_t:CDS:2 [Gigaspora margarita]|uniref:28545_t:CDS:1 n=1 Tax=Gigaspora margarita TaxID=4874 RepID=A0ABN7W1R7_GIGMA|nr:28545_t:CDS:2 [Gigaspora margarita]